MPAADSGRGSLFFSVWVLIVLIVALPPLWLLLVLSPSGNPTDHLVRKWARRVLRWSGCRLSVRGYRAPGARALHIDRGEPLELSGFRGASGLGACRLPLCGEPPRGNAAARRPRHPEGRAARRESGLGSVPRHLRARHDCRASIRSVPGGLPRGHAGRRRAPPIPEGAVQNRGCRRLPRHASRDRRHGRHPSSPVSPSAPRTHPRDRAAARHGRLIGTWRRDPASRAHDSSAVRVPRCTSMTEPPELRYDSGAGRDQRHE